ncbi:MAG: DUF1501 domain-containing protein, partial [Verrucomicrobiota bacterium]
MKLHTLWQEEARRRLEQQTRRHFLRDGMTGLGGLWLGLQGSGALAAGAKLDPIQFAPKAKRVIFLHMVGAPSTLDLFNYRPELAKYSGKECPQEFLEGERFAFIQGVPKMLGPQFDFQQHGQSGAYVSDRFSHLTKHVDDMCFVHTTKTDQFNHGPAQLMMHTGHAILGHGSMGSWATWGLGSENENLPGFMVLLSGGRRPRGGNALWAAGHLPSVYQGVQCRSVGEPVLNTTNPAGVSHELRGQAIKAINAINQDAHATIGDPETLTRIAQYEMAYRMQVSVPEVMDVESESPAVLEMYGAEPGKMSFANNCLLARRLAESGVRFIQLYDWGWDSHGASKTEALNEGFKDKCRSVDQPISALLTDLQQRGLLEDTLVIWGGEFGRTPMQENRGGGEMAFVGR